MFILMYKHTLQREQTVSEAILDIKHWGNSLGVRLPAALAREAGLTVDQRVRLVVEDGRVVITPVINERLTLEQRLATYDVQRHGGEALSTDEHLGAERW